MENAKPWNGELKQKNFWVFGATGTGKPRWARQQAEDFHIYPKPNNKQWGGYDKAVQRIVTSRISLSMESTQHSAYKIWADRFSFIAKIIGGAIRVDPGKYIMIVTSNYALDEVFEGEDLKALKRRFHEVEIKDSNGVFLQTRIDLKILN